MRDLPQMMDMHEVADILKVHYRTALRLVRSKRLPSIKAGKRDYRVSLEALTSFINGGNVGTDLGTPTDEPTVSEEIRPLPLAHKNRAKRVTNQSESKWYERFR